MILLDTNVLYRLSGIEEDDNVNIANLNEYLIDKECFCSLFSFFEILNSKFSFKEKYKVISYMSKNHFKVEGEPTLNETIKSQLFGQPKDEKYYDKLKIIYGKHIIPIISKNITFFIKSYAYNCATIYIDNYEKSLSEKKLYYRKHFEIEQKEIDKHIGKIVEREINNLLDKDEFNADNVQRMLLLLIANLMTYYHELLRVAKDLFENNDSQAYYKIIKKLKFLKRKILNDQMSDDISYDFTKLSVCYSIIDYFNESGELKPSQVKNQLIKRILDSIYYPNPSLKNEFEEVWLKRNITSLCVESAKIKPNDFIDYEILRELYYFQDIDILITFDNKMQNIMKGIKGNSKFVDSIKLIESLKK